jgi:acyl carrier protein
MGLDSVELVIRVEETFGIAVPDEEAEKIITVGDLHRCVLAKLAGQERETPHCLSASTFYRLRRGIIDRFGIDRHCVRPRSPINNLIPGANRRSEWQRLGQSLGWRLPELGRPSWVWTALFGLLLAWLVLVIIVWGQLTAFTFEPVILMGIGFLAGASLLAAMVHGLTRPLAVCFPSRTMRDMVTLILVLNFDAICKDQAGWNRREVWESLRAIIVDQLGVSPDEVRESANFVYDLGVD